MIKWYKDLYTDNFIKEKLTKYKRYIEKGKVTFGIYCILLASNENNLFDIINSNELMFPYYQRRELKIVGLAISRESAMELVTNMVDEMYCVTGNFNCRDYFKFN